MSIQLLLLKLTSRSRLSGKGLNHIMPILLVLPIHAGSAGTICTYGSFPLIVHTYLPNHISGSLLLLSI
jgi:hypothetical protein